MSNLNNFSLRPAREDEYDILNAIKLDACLRFDKDYITRSLERDISSHDVGNDSIEVAVDGQDVPQGFTTSFPVDGDLFLYHLYVRREMGKQGLGTILLKEVIERAASEKRRAVTLCTALNVPWNAPYYSRHGFVVLKDEKMPDYLLKFLNEDREHFTPQNFPLVLQRPELLPRVAMERLVL